MILLYLTLFNKGHNNVLSDMINYVKFDSTIIVTSRYHTNTKETALLNLDLSLST